MHPVLFHIGAVLIPSYGVLAALGVLLALLTAQQTARVVGIAPAHLWNLCVIALCAALIGARVLLVIANWRDVLQHPLWMLGLAMIHHPLVTAAGVAVGLFAGWLYAYLQHLPIASAADALAAPIAVCLSMEQWGALLAGSGYGTLANTRWAVTYTSAFAEHWSGTPLGIPLHPVQAYAAIGYLSLAVVLLLVLPARRQAGDAIGTGLLGAGIVVFITEFWRDWEGRGTLWHGAIDGPQLAAILMVLAGALLLRERKYANLSATRSTSRQGQS